MNLPTPRIAPADRRCEAVNQTPVRTSYEARVRHPGERCRRAWRETLAGQRLCGEHARMARGEPVRRRFLTTGDVAAIARAIRIERAKGGLLPGDPWPDGSSIRILGMWSYRRIAAEFGTSVYTVSRIGAEVAREGLAPSFRLTVREGAV